MADEPQEPQGNTEGEPGTIEPTAPPAEDPKPPPVKEPVVETPPAKEEPAAPKKSLLEQGEGTQEESAPAPEYEPFTIPEGVTVNEEALTAWGGKAREMELTQGQAQGVIDFQTDQLAKAEAAGIAEIEAVDNYKSEILAPANRAMTLATAEDAAFLQNALGNNPQFLRLMAAVGKRMKEDVSPGGGASPPVRKGPAGMYPSMDPK